MPKDTEVFATSAPPIDVATTLLDLPGLRQRLHSDDLVEVLGSAQTLRRLLAVPRNAPTIQKVVDQDVIPRLVELLTHNTHTSNIQFEAAWCITNIASSTTAPHTLAVVRHGALPKLVRLLYSPVEQMREQAAWALGNIAGESTATRDQVIQAKALEPLLQLCRRHNSSAQVIQVCTWTISNCMRGLPQPDFEHIQHVLPILVSVLTDSNEAETLGDICLALARVTDELGPEEQNIRAVLDTSPNVVPRLVALMRHANPSVSTHAIRTIGNLVSGHDDEHTQLVLDAAVLPAIQALLASPRPNIRREVMWALSNIAAGSRDQIQQLLDFNLIGPVLQMIPTEVCEVQKEIAWVLANVTAAQKVDHITILVREGALLHLCTLLKSNKTNILLPTLDAINNILAVQEGFTYATVLLQQGAKETVFQLLTHADNEIAEKAGSVLGSLVEVEDLLED